MEKKKKKNFKKDLFSDKVKRLEKYLLIKLFFHLLEKLLV